MYSLNVFTVCPGATTGVGTQAQMSAINFVTVGMYFKSVLHSFHIVIIYHYCKLLSPYQVGWRYLHHAIPWRGVVVSALSSINEVNQHRARLLLGWVTVCGQVNRLGM